MIIYCTEDDWEALCDTIAFSIQMPFFHCHKEGCLCKEAGDDCYKWVDECLKENWEVHITDV